MLGLLYHTIMDRKGVSVDAILSPPTHLLLIMCKINITISEDLPMLLQLQ